MEALGLPHQCSKFDLSFYFKERADGGYDVHLEYCTELFSQRTVSRMGLLDCLGWVGGAAPLSVGDLRWRKPATCGPGCRVALLTRQEGDSLTVELHNSQPGAGHTENWSIAASARLTSMAAPPTHPAPLDVEALCKNLREAEPQPEPHTAPQNGPQLNVSGRWQCRERLWLSQDGNTLLARLCLPEAYRGDFNTFRWHPAMRL